MQGCLPFAFTWIQGVAEASERPGGGVSDALRGMPGEGARRAQRGDGPSLRRGAQRYRKQGRRCVLQQ